MLLDVIIPTYNRQHLLELTLRSLFVAEVPSGCDVVVTVVDNNSSDQTAQVVQSFQEKFGDRMRYRFESKQGRSHALNHGIIGSTADLVGTIDDDEEIDVNWYKHGFEAFRTKELDFVGGPYVPRFENSPPAWIPREYGAVIGWVDGGDKEVPFDSNYPGILMGGNAIFKRSVFDKIGLYTTWLGRTDKGLLTGEDEELYGRLLASGAKGVYLPNLIVYHHILPERLTKSYFRRWCFWRGVSLGLLDRTRKLPCPYLFGIPRWHYRQAAKGVLSTLRSLVAKPKNPPQAFAAELGFWDWLGLVHGRHFHKRFIRRQNSEKA